jgi:hypothetical protein
MHLKHKFQTILYFDMRAPDFGAPAVELYAEALEMAAFADKIGVDRVGLMGASRLGRRLSALAVRDGRRHCRAHPEVAHQLGRREESRHQPYARRHCAPPE